MDKQFAEFEKTVNQALAAVQTLGPAPAGRPERPTAAQLAGIPPEMADVTQIKSIAEEFKSKSEAFAPIADRFIELAEDFDFEGISKLAGELEKMAESG